MYVFRVEILLTNTSPKKKNGVNEYVKNIWRETTYSAKRDVAGEIITTFINNNTWIYTNIMFNGGGGGR